MQESGQMDFQEKEYKYYIENVSEQFLCTCMCLHVCLHVHMQNACRHRYCVHIHTVTCMHMHPRTRTARELCTFIIMTASCQIQAYSINNNCQSPTTPYHYCCLSPQFGPNGKKILASFHCDMAEYAGVPSAE